MQLAGYYQIMESDIVAMKEEALLLRLKDADVSAFNYIFYAYSKPVLKNIHRFVKDEQYAEDVLQDVFVRLWERKSQLSESVSLGGWLMVVSHNMALNFLQSKVKEKLIATSSDEEKIFMLAEETTNNKLQLEAQLLHLEKTIQALPHKQLQAFTLCRLQSKTYAQASDIMGISPHTVREYVAKAMDKVRREFIGVPSDTVFLLLLLLSLK